MKEFTRTDAVDGASILNDFIGDLVAGVMLLLEYRDRLKKPGDQNALLSVQKMCLSYLILTLQKWTEFYNKYNGMFEEGLRSQCKELNKRLQRRNIDDFRNKCIGHIWDKEKNRPLYNSEITIHINKITLHDLEGFLRWLHNPDGNKYPGSVVSIVETCRDYLVAKYNIAHDELLER